MKQKDKIIMYANTHRKPQYFNKHRLRNLIKIALDEADIDYEDQIGNSVDTITDNIITVLWEQVTCHT